MKLKTNSSMKKRVKITGSGKFRFQKSAKQHLLVNKSKRQKGAHPNGKPTSPGNEARIKTMLPYL